MQKSLKNDFECFLSLCLIEHWTVFINHTIKAKNPPFFLSLKKVTFMLKLFTYDKNCDKIKVCANGKFFHGLPNIDVGG